MLRKNNKRMPDVLDCLANLSNDEVFTPPEIANKMLDLIPQEVFESKETTFLDPFTKSGVFLREITKRLLAHQIPNYEEMSVKIDEIEKAAIQEAVKSGNLDLQDPDYDEKAKKIGRDAINIHPRVGEFHEFEEKLQKELNRILKTQVFGIAITELTAQLTRRSLYCSKNAAGQYSICTEFDNEDGNIRFKSCKHVWDKKPKWIELDKKWTGGTCIFCGANSENFDRPDDLEQHAYEFIHTPNAERIFNMKFDVICGNPPYQLSTTANTEGRIAATQAQPIFHLFVEQAKRLDPKYLTMIIPARWYNGGIGLNEFRQVMFTDKHLKTLVDYQNSMDCFSGVAIAGGVCYFLWDKTYNSDLCEVVNIAGDETNTLKRPLTETGFIRNNKAVSIKDKVTSQCTEFLDSVVLPLNPFNFNANERGNSTKEDGDVELINSQGVGFVKRDSISKNEDLIDKWKVTIGKVVPSNGEVGIDPSKGYKSITKPRILKPNQIHTFSYILLNSFDDENTAENFRQYMCTKFARFMLRLTYSGMNISKANFIYVPKLDFSKQWDDDTLYKHFCLTEDEREYINTLMRAMDEEEK